MEDFIIGKGIKITKRDVSPVSYRVTTRRERRDMPDGTTKRFRIKTTTRFKTPRLAGNLEFEVMGGKWLCLGDICEIKCGLSTARAVVVNKIEDGWLLKSPSVMEYFSTEIGEPESLIVVAHSAFESPWGSCPPPMPHELMRYELKNLGK